MRPTYFAAPIRSARMKAAVARTLGESLFGFCNEANLAPTMPLADDAKDEGKESSANHTDGW
jgi:hypothetical protein